MPNAKLSTAIVTNYALPLAPQNFVVNVGVAYGTDLARAERIALEVARDVLTTVPEGVPGFEPAVLRYSGFGDSSVNFFVVMQARAYPDRSSVISEFVKRLHGRYRQASRFRSRNAWSTCGTSRRCRPRRRSALPAGVTGGRPGPPASTYPSRRQSRP